MISGGAASVRNVTGSPPGVPLAPGGCGPVDGTCTMTRSASTKVAKTRKMRRAVWRCLLREAEAGNLRLGTAGCGATHIRLLAQKAESGRREDPALFRDDSRHLKHSVLEEERKVCSESGPSLATSHIESAAGCSRRPRCIFVWPSGEAPSNFSSKP